jgi:hypothetical protein
LATKEPKGPFPAIWSGILKLGLVVIAGGGQIKLLCPFFRTPEIFDSAPPTEDFRKNPEVGASGSGVFPLEMRLKSGLIEGAVQ